MGMPLFGSCSLKPDRCEYCGNSSKPQIIRVEGETRIIKIPVPVPQMPNPNPARFKILRVEEVGKHCVAEIFYPDCTNFEGRKILVYENTELEDVFHMKTIDPHFAENVYWKTPIARFKPTGRGWDLALKFARMIQKKEG